MKTVMTVASRSARELRRSTFALVILVISIPVSGAPEDTPELNLQPYGERLAGQVADGTPLLRGTLHYQQRRQGFRVTLDAVSTALRGGRYRLRGAEGHWLNVRLDAQHQGAQRADQPGIIVHAGAAPAHFTLVTDGPQDIAADRWDIRVIASAIVHTASPE